jgi:hypothetical protein
MMDRYLEYLNKQLTEREKQLTQALADGAAKSYDAYVQLVGEIRGLSFAQLCVNDLVRKLENDDNE